jgi:hypothetical protein
MGRLGDYIGAAIGCLGWVIGFAIVCYVSGNMAVLVHFVLLATVISLAMAGLLIASIELLVRTYGYGSTFQLMLWGELLFFMGLLVLLISHWIAPIIDASPTMVSTMRNLHASYRMGDLVPTVSISTGALLLAITVFRLLTSLPSQRRSPVGR